MYVCMYVCIHIYTYLVCCGEHCSMKLNQNSIMLLDKGIIASDSVLEVTHKILKYDSTEAISTPGDVLALLATTKGNQRLLLVSFHGNNFFFDPVNLELEHCL